jgi:acetyl esterase/lipase
MILATLYLLLGLALLAATLGAIFPRIYGAWLTPAGALASTLLILGWPLFLFNGLALTALVAWTGALHTPFAQAGLALHVGAWGLLAYYHYRVHHALPVLDGSEVPDDQHPFSAHLTDEERALLGELRVSPWPIAFRTPAMRRVEVTRNVVFREVGGVRLRVDVYRPRERSGTLPSAVYLHGGGWILGSRRQSPFLMYELAAAGWAVFAVSYRLAPRFPLPAAVHDAKAALAWVREHAHEYGAEPDAVVLGGSAGGHLALLMALTANDARFQPDFASADTRVRGAVVLYGFSDLMSALEERPHPGVVAFFERVVFKQRYRDDPETFRLLHPPTHVSATAAPVLLVHGRHDEFVPFAQSERLYRSLLAVGANDTHLLEVPFGLHAFEILPSPLHQRAIRIILRFMESLRREGVSSPAR